MKKVCLLAMILGVLSCKNAILSEAPTKLYLKRIETPSVRVEWYFHSLISSTTPDIVTVTKNGSLDTVCRAQNVKDVQLTDSTLVLEFYGAPRCYGKEITIPTSLNGIGIETDPNHNGIGPTYRRTFTAN